MGSSAGSETTSAALGKAGVMRRDPFAMLPFCGYHMGDYLTHWLSMTNRTDRANLPKIFFVNWFRKNAEGKFLWPGYGDNSRVLKWVCDRIEANIKAVPTPIGNLPKLEDLDTTGLDICCNDMKDLLSVDAEGWKNELADISQYYEKFGDRLPEALKKELESLRSRLEKN
jgi:phosphoenolpyruvate carboxykinase (GTP)